MSGKDVIMFGLQPWDIEIGSNFKNIAEVMSLHNRVLYVNRPLDRITYFKSKNDSKTLNRLKSIRNQDNHLTEIKNNLWVLNPPVILESINWLPPGILYRYLNKRNGKKIANAINIAIGQLNFKKDILIVDNDFFNGLYLKEFLQPDFFLYYLRDYLRSQNYFKKHGNLAEPQIIHKANAVASNSLYLTSYAGKLNPNSFYVGQGCDVDAFLSVGSEMPPDIKRIEAPVIGYCGMLTAQRLDIDLLCHIASSLPGFQLVLVGPQDDAFQRSPLHDFSNVHFLGSKEPHQLPAYVHSFDICINPQLVNQMTIGNYPRKIDEYLAAGKPVVGTRTDTMMAFKDVVYLSDSPNDFVEKIKLAFDEDDVWRREARVAVAKNHTWEASVEMIYKIINEKRNDGSGKN